MANITLTYKGLTGQLYEITIDDGQTFTQLKAAIATNEGLSADYYSNVSVEGAPSNSSLLTPNATLASAGLTTGSVRLICASPSTGTKEEKQLRRFGIVEEKLAADGDTTAPFYRARHNFNVAAMKKRYVGNTVVINAEATGDYWSSTPATSDLTMTFVIPSDNYQTNWAGAFSTSGGVDGSIDWGDGTTDDYTSSGATTFSHTFATAGTYTVVVSGTWRRLQPNNSNAINAITTVSHLGSCGWENLNSMFRNCKNLTSFTAGNCDTSAVTDMALFLSMNFVTAQLTSVDLTGMDTSSVTTMSEAFNGQNVLTEFTGIGALDVSSVTNFQNCFNSCPKLLTLDLSSWDTSSATNMSGMFSNSFNTFANLENVNVNLAGWDVTNVTNTSYMFNGCRYVKSYGDLSGWVFSSVTNAQRMFYQNTNLGKDGASFDVSNFDFGAVTNMSDLFYECQYLTDFSFLSSWNISSSLTTMYSFLRSTRRAITSVDLSGWDTSGVTGTGFKYAFKQYGVNDSNTDRTLNVANWDVTSATDFQGMFETSKTNLTGLSTWNMSNATDIDQMFQDLGNNNASTLDCSNWTLTNCTNLRDAVRNVNSLMDVSAIGTWTTPAAENLHMTVKDTDNIPDLSNWDTSNVTTMYGLFEGASFVNASALQSIQGWDTSNVTNMGSMFYAHNTQPATYTLDLSGWNTSSVTSVDRTFYAFDSGTTINVSNWDTTNVFNMRYTFYFCGATVIGVNTWNPRSVTLGTNFMRGANNDSVLSQADYDTLLVDWEADIAATVGYSNTPSFDFTYSNFTSGGAGEVARTALVNTHGWSISDSGGV